MARKTASPPTFDKKRNRWRVTIPATLSPEGKRLRSWHLTRDAALLKQHYLGQLTKKDALSILSIGPKGSKVSNIKAA